MTTAFVNAGVEGTEFFMRVEEDKTFLSIFEGKVLASNAAGSLILTSGQSAIAEAGKAPVLGVWYVPETQCNGLFIIRPSFIIALPIFRVFLRTYRQC